MNQLVRIQGASSQETFWFSRACNAITGQIDHIPRTMKPLQFAASKALNGQPAHASRPFPCIFSRFHRHFDPVYESMTKSLGGNDI